MYRIYMRVSIFVNIFPFTETINVGIVTKGLTDCI